MEVMAQNMALHTVMVMGTVTAMGMEMGMDILPTDIMKRTLNPIKRALLVG